MNPNQIAMLGEWAVRPLAELLAEAQAEPAGNAFTALWQEGQRKVVVCCIVRASQIRQLENMAELPFNRTEEDWGKLTLGAFAARAARAGGLASESQWTPDGRRSALALIANGPDSIRMLQSLIVLPP